MKGIKVISDQASSVAKFLKVRNVVFEQNGIARSWDYLSSMDAVTAFILDKTSKEFVFVKQFRPALYFGASELTKQTIHSSTMGNCYELCAGILDRKGRTKEQAIIDEIREELGYDVKQNQLQFITRTVGAVGITGGRMYMFYTEITPEQKIYPGGGLKEEGEQIAEYRVPVDRIDSFISDYEKEKSAAIVMGVYWWKYLRHLNKEWSVCYVIIHRFLATLHLPLDRCLPTFEFSLVFAPSSLHWESSRLALQISLP